ncbi:MAG: leucyl aminopeptidase family protein [Alphaproteobacteria bacterium]|nr:leucyl aminopeptidase family protein [Alphaproteobacteria bacterium]
MLQCFAGRANARTIPLVPLRKDGLQTWLKKQADRRAAWVTASGFTAEPGTVLLLPVSGRGGDKAVEAALVGIRDDDDIWSWASAADRLPAGRYRFGEKAKAGLTARATLGWALGSYSFDRYKRSKGKAAELVLPKGSAATEARQAAESIYLVRDLINTPSSDMGPGELASAAQALSREFKGRCKVTIGDALLRDNYPMIHAVGRASSRPPRLIDMTWGRARDPKVTLVGKGVCFDTGGLDLKPASNMLLMKKDMGGAAHVLGLARMIMAAKLPVRLRVLVPAVENSVSGDAFRPLDVLSSRAGKSVEIGNTDAEGRLILADALTEALSESPTLLLDFATLTGAARVALGPELPAMFCNDAALAKALEQSAEAEDDPVWRMPLWRSYRRYLDSTVADINNTSSVPQAGAVTAAVFLHEFVGDDVPWAHFDIYGWNAMARPGRQKGGEAMALRAAFRVIQQRCG